MHICILRLGETKYILIRALKLSAVHDNLKCCNAGVSLQVFLEPYLQLYQTDKPMIHFMYNDLVKLFKRSSEFIY